MSNLENPNFLKQKYDLHNAPEVAATAKRAEIKTGEKVPQNPEARIQNYLDRFKEITDRQDSEKREHGLDAIKRLLHTKFVIKPEEIPEAYFDNQKRLAREQGHGDVEITNEAREQLTEVVVSDQKSTLDNWIDYLSSEDATYPDWLKYYAFRSILGLGEYDKDKKQFTKRSKGTVKPFPDLNREALAYVLDAIEKKYQGQIPDEQEAEFQKYLQGENFAKLYAWAIDKVTPASQEALASTKGEWVKYNRHSDHMPLVESLRGHGTGWCTAGESTAKAQLNGGDFYVYYSFDEQGQPTIPRAAIRMQDHQIGEVRGVAPEQNLDPYIGGIVQEKLREFPDGAAYEKKNNDMKLLTEIDKKSKQQKPLTKDDLVFLYEINNTIEGFGYQRDPRIKEIIDTRDPKQDAPIVLECEPSQIAWEQADINENTKAYVGEWNIEIFQTVKNYPNIKHLYESFPDKKIFLQSIETDPNINSPQKAEEVLRNKNIYLSDYGQDILYKTEFSQEKEKYDLVRFTVNQLGFPKEVTTDKIYKRAQELGLELCPAEVGPHLRLQYSGKEWMRIAMKQIADRDGDPNIFDLHTDGEQLELNGHDAKPDNRWSPGHKFVFRFSKLDAEKF